MKSFFLWDENKIPEEKISLFLSDDGAKAQTRNNNFTQEYPSSTQPSLTRLTYHDWDRSEKFRL